VPFPDDQLVSGERLLVHEHPHPKMLVLPALSFVAVCAGGGYLAALISGESWRGVGWTVITVVALALIVWFTVAPPLRWLNTHFVVTDRRVLVREGVLSRVGFEIPLNRIDSVQFQQGLVDRMFGCGTLSIESASDEPVDFDDIPKVQRVHLVLQDAADRRDPYGDPRAPRDPYDDPY
jgi:uncharacterized membrane protein YdbT with pleckstrin-like domain